MSDGQAYLLLLALLYVAETCALGPPGSLLLTSLGGRRFTPKKAVLPLGGVGKELFFKPLLPAFPVSLFLPPLSAPSLRTPTPASVGRLRSITQRATGNLRMFSFFIFLLFFVGSPVAYYYQGDSPLTTLLVAYGYGLMVLNGCQYFCLHRRLLPRKGLWTESLFSALLPWHSMRAADHLLTIPSHHIHPLSTLLSLPQSPKRDALLHTFWLEAKESGQSALFAPWFNNRGLDPDDLFPPPVVDSPDAVQFCPQCQATFTAAAQQCSDCSVELKPLGS